MSNTDKNEPKTGPRYVFSDDMAEISGFGGGYEEACRAMVVAGLEWLDANPKADPQFGSLFAENKDGEQLSAAVVAACDDCTGAMHGAAISHILWIRRNGWDRYCTESRERKGAVR